MEIKGGMVADFFVRLLLAHMVADWVLQNEWMALNKVSLRHPASWVHSALHAASVAALTFSWWATAITFVTHILIDTRVPLQWWRRVYRQTTEGPIMVPFGMWQDQAAHLIVIAVLALAWR